MRRLKFRVAEYLVEVIHQVCSWAQIWAQGGGSRALIITHYTIPPLGHPDGVLPPCTLLWGQKLQWLQRASDTLSLAREPGRSDLLQAQGHHGAQFSACELQNQSYEASTVQDKSLNPSSYWRCYSGRQVTSPLWASMSSSSKWGEHHSYGLNGVPQKSACWSPDPQCNGICRWSLWVVIRFRWDHECGILQVRLVPL